MGLFIGKGRSLSERSPVLITAAALLVLVTIGIAFTAHWYVIQRTEALADEIITSTEEAFVGVSPFTNRDAAALRQFPNRVHVERARELGIDRIANREAAMAIKESANLVLLEDTPHYVVQPMTYSIPYVTEDTAHLLDIIGERFRNRLGDIGLPPFRYVITSATRTSDDQQRLRRVNANAAEVSSHFHGTTVDIHYARFDYSPDHDEIPEGSSISQPVLGEALNQRFSAMTEEYQPQLKSILGDVMKDVQRDGLVMVTYERQQPVYHITVNQRIAEPPSRDNIPSEVAGFPGLDNASLSAR
jgi:hypothetical protein